MRHARKRLYGAAHTALNARIQVTGCDVGFIDGGSMQNSDLPSFQSHRPVGPQERERLIAEAAYRRAEQRNFTAGDPLDDWLQAEREIDRSLGESRSADQESAAYER